MRRDLVSNLIFVFTIRFESQVSHGRYIRVLGPVFLRLKSLLSPYWRQPQRLRYQAWRTIRKSMRPSNLVRELQQLGLPPALNRFINLEE